MTHGGEAPAGPRAAAWRRCSRTRRRRPPRRPHGDPRAHAPHRCPSRRSSGTRSSRASASRRRSSRSSPPPSASTASSSRSWSAGTARRYRDPRRRAALAGRAARRAHARSRRSLREASEREAFELALVENLQRADLNAIEEAEAYEVLIAASTGSPRSRSRERVGKERSTVANALRLLKLPADVRDLVRGRAARHGARPGAPRRSRSAEAIRKMAQRVVREGLSVRATEALVRLAHPEGEASGPPRAARRPPSGRSPQRLQRRLGARCRVVPKSAVAGRLEVEYTSLDELDGILAKIGA